MEDEREKLWIWMSTISKKRKEIYNMRDLVCGEHTYQSIAEEPCKIQVYKSIDRIAELFEVGIKRDILPHDHNRCACTIQIGDIKIIEVQDVKPVDDGYQE